MFGFLIILQGVGLKHKTENNLFTPGTLELLKSSQLYPWVFPPRARRVEPARRRRGRARARKQARGIFD
jgi:hypothetical protein